MSLDENVDEELRKASEVVKNRFVHPLIAREPEIVPGLPESDTARFNLATHECEISSGFVAELVGMGVSLPVALRAILTREYGYYVIFPREVSSLLYLAQVAESEWPVEGHGRFFETALNMYVDVVENIDSLRSNVRSPELALVHKALAKSCEGKAEGRLDRLLVALYQEATGLDLGVSLKGDTELEEKLTRLSGISYAHDTEIGHAVSLLTFSNAIRDLVTEKPEEAPAMRGCNLLGSLTSEQVNDALNDVIRKNGKLRYDLIHGFVKKAIPGFKDRFEDDGHGKGIGQAFAGTENVDKISWHDELVPYYKRLASTYGVFIATKPMETNASDLYPAEQAVFEVGDGIRRINPWSTPGIFPELTQRYKEEASKRTMMDYRIPDLLLLQDTSGSIDEFRLYHEVLAAFILGRNYHANGSKVGLGNFSADMLFVPPSRDIEAYYRAACARWGGGTVVNIDKLNQWLVTLQQLGDERFKGAMVSTAEDYAKMAEKMTLEEKKRVEEKRIEIQTGQKVPEIYKRLDTVLITDGDIANIAQVVDWLNSIAEETRNTIMLVKSPQEYEAWKKLGLKRTTIYHIEDRADLVGLAIGRARAVALEGREPAYRGQGA